jgi:hypothetical protein
MRRSETEAARIRLKIHPLRGTAAFRTAALASVLAWAGGFGRASAAFEEVTLDARAAAMGSVSIASFGPESVFFNPAGIGGGGSGSVCFSSAVPFGLKELSVHAVFAEAASRAGSFGLAVSTFGQSAYRETAFAAGWRARFGGRVDVGIASRTLNLRIGRYGSWTGWALDVAVRVPLGERWAFGFSGTNINQACVESRSPVPQTARIGLIHEHAGGLTLAAEIEKDARYPAEFHAGTEWKPVAGLALRWGIGRGPAQFSFGFGLARRRFGLDYACTVHPVLGATHRASIRLHFRGGD